MKNLIDSYLICVVDNFVAADIIVDRLKKEKYNIIKLEVSKKNIKGVRMSILCRKIRKKIKTPVQRIYLPSQNGYSLLFYYFMSNGGKSELLYYEEGLYSYVHKYENRDPFAEYYNIHPKLRYVFGRKKYNYNNICILYSPEMAEINDSKTELIKLPCYPDVIKLFLQNDISDMIKNSKYIFFDNYFINQSERVTRYMDCLKVLVNKFDDLIIKKHPRTDYSNCFINVEKRKLICDINLWEAELGELDISEKNLISVFSTATVMPSIIYDYSYNAVFLYRYVLLDDQEQVKKYDYFLERLNRKKRINIIQVSSIEELSSFVETCGV